MATMKENFDSYKIWCYSGFSYEALVYCYRGDTYVGRLVFFKDGMTIPPNDTTPSGMSIHYPISRLNEILTILRHEKPLYIFLSTTSKVGSVGTEEQEPVGEDEPV